MAFSVSSRMLLLSVLAIASLASVHGACSQCTSQCGSCPPSPDTSYEYLLFVLQWPGTFCRQDPQCCEGKLPEEVDWTIHGLWPEKSQDCYPYCCDLDSVQFSHKSVADLSDLKTLWPTLSCKNTDDSFHSNEWDKHGTCALRELEAKAEDPVNYYFKKALELRENLDLGKILAAQGIVASDSQTYALADIVNTISAVTGHIPDVNCKSGNILDEVHFCIAKDLETYIDCPTAAELAAKATHDMVTRGHHGGQGGGKGKGGGKGPGGHPKKKRAQCNDSIRIPVLSFQVSTQ